MTKWPWLYDNESEMQPHKNNIIKNSHTIHTDNENVPL